MAKSSSVPPSFILIFVLSFSFLDIEARICNDPESRKLAGTDYGHIISSGPAKVICPSSVDDIVSLVKSSLNDSFPFTIAARGKGHSIWGQAMAVNGDVVLMTSLNDSGNGSRIAVSSSPSLGNYADVGGEQMWIDVLNMTFQQGLSPVSWVDYLYLSVGGTLSNAGISGQTFKHGPQITNVYELDVVTGNGELVTCSKDVNPDLFYAVLGGLGQFGIITRARIALAPAPTRVKWVQMLYTDFSAFMKDQEHLISVDGLDYLEGFLLQRSSPPDNSSFFPPSDLPRIISLLNDNGIVYSIEAVKYFDDHSSGTIDQELQQLLQRLNFLSGFVFTKDASYVEFLNRVHNEELALRAKGLWDIPHPWLNLFIPKSQMFDIDSGVFKGIIRQQQQSTAGPVIIYPMFRNKWDNRMSAVTPDERIFYHVALLHGSNDLETLENQNNQVLEFCDRTGIKYKHYLAYYETQAEWINHFGWKWKTFQDRKAQFDPKAILAPGQRIFNRY